MGTIKTFIAGHRGLVGSALLRRYQQEPSRRLLTHTHQELDLTDSVAVDWQTASGKPMRGSWKIQEPSVSRCQTVQRAMGLSPWHRSPRVVPCHGDKPRGSLKSPARNVKLFIAVREHPVPTPHE